MNAWAVACGKSYPNLNGVSRSTWRTMLGREYEVVAHSGASHVSHSVGPENVWQFQAPYEGISFFRYG
ncbi:hypothetical protein NPIL_105001 [Nephila pilipes]|uniref:Uncharacterized protein n=1 Tax=Nephila pilipes TaxID=299642 RepID=A0A8X6N4X7_NEPPI|nr:hypothetical protein NPIL_105001 [Nephila pilipes]